MNSAMMLLLCRIDKRLSLGHIEIEEQRSTGDSSLKASMSFYIFTVKGQIYAKYSLN